MLGRQAVVHGHDSHPMAAAELEVPRVVHLGCTHHHPAAVEVQVDGGGGAVGPEHPARHSGDLPDLCLRDRGIAARHQVPGLLHAGLPVGGWRARGLEHLGHGGHPGRNHLPRLVSHRVSLVGPQLHDVSPLALRVATKAESPSTPARRAVQGGPQPPERDAHHRVRTRDPGACGRTGADLYPVDR